MNYKKIIFPVFLFFLGVHIYAQPYNVNYDESKVRTYCLPSIFTTQGGITINSTQDWENFRRSEILQSFICNIYGRVPGIIDSQEIIVKEKDENAFNGLARRRQLSLVLKKNGKAVNLDLLIYLPKRSKGEVPVFLSYNFYGNQGVGDDQHVFITNNWIPIRTNLGLDSHVASEQSRGVMKRRWPVEKIIRSGYGLVTAYCGDIDPDKDDFSDGVHALFYDKDQVRHNPGEWGTIAAWSWGLSRIMDYLETDKEIDDKKVVVMGHSRLGKTALWAAATDTRFAACISNNSGCMGASLSRRDFGETIDVINQAFPHWFCGAFKKYSGKEHMLPVDQHMLLALIAPRPLYIASASEDLWADPFGEFLSAKYASSVYNLYGINGLSAVEMPQPDSPVIDVVSYHIRIGIHDVTKYDWEQFIKFADKNLK